MRKYLSVAIILTLCLISMTPLAAQDDAFARQLKEHDRRLAEAAQRYERDLKEYDRRWAEQQASAQRQERGRWLPLIAMVGTAVLLLLWGGRSRRRQAAASMTQMQAAVREGAEQNRRIIELLESIDRKLSPPSVSPPSIAPPSAVDRAAPDQGDAASRAAM